MMLIFATQLIQCRNVEYINLLIKYELQRKHFFKISGMNSSEFRRNTVLIRNY